VLRTLFFGFLPRSCRPSPSFDLAARNNDVSWRFQPSMMRRVKPSETRSRVDQKHRRMAAGCGRSERGPRAGQRSKEPGQTPEEGDFVARAPKGSITKMIGSAIGGDGNCVNGVIITNLEAISSRPDQSEDALPFPEPGPSTASSLASSSPPCPRWAPSPPPPPASLLATR